MAGESKVSFGPLTDWKAEEYLGQISRDSDLSETHKSAGEKLAFLKSSGVSGSVFEIYNSIMYFCRHPEEISSNPSESSRYNNINFLRGFLTDIPVPIRAYTCDCENSICKAKVYPVEVIDQTVLEEIRAGKPYFRYPVYFAVDSLEFSRPQDILVGKPDHLDIVLPGLIEACKLEAYDLGEGECMRLGRMSKDFPKGAKAYLLDRRSLPEGAYYMFITRLLDAGYTHPVVELLDEVSEEYILLDEEIRKRMEKRSSSEGLLGYN